MFSRPYTMGTGLLPFVESGLLIEFDQIELQTMINGSR